MTLTDRDLLILSHLRRYFYLRTVQIRDLIAPHDDDGSITRGRLRKLSSEGFVRRYQPKLADVNGSIAPIFALTMKGANALATERGDSTLLLSVEPNFADWMSMNHFCALSSLHMMIDASIASQDYVRMHNLYFEHEVLQSDSAELPRRYRLYTVVAQSPRVVCCPDSAFETSVCDYRRAFYIEREMGSDTPARVAAKKCKGYAGMASGSLFLRHFPQARDFRVLWFCPNAGWRDALRREMRGKSGSEMSLFVASPELSSASVLHGAIWHTIDRGPFPLVPPPAVRPAADPGAGASPDFRAEAIR